MKKVLSLILSMIMILSVLTIPATAHVDEKENVYNFNDFTADESGKFISPDTNLISPMARTEYVDDSTPYNEIYLTDEGNGDKALTFKSTKKAYFGTIFKDLNYSGTVEIGCTLKIDDLNARRYFGLYDCPTQGGYLFMANNQGYTYVSGVGMSGSYKVNANDELDMKFYINLNTGYVHSVINKNGSAWIDTVNNEYAKFKNSTLKMLCFYQTEYANANGAPAVSHWDDFYVKPTNRVYNTCLKTYDFNNFAGSADGYTTMPDGFTRAYGTAYVNSSSPYEGIFAQSTNRGTSIKIESNVKRTGNAKDAPYIKTNASVLSTETGYLEFSVMRPEKSCALFVNFGVYNKPLAVLTNFGDLYVLDKNTGISMPKKNEWYDVKMQYSTGDLTAYVEVYNNNELVGCSAILQTDENRNSYKNVKGTDVTVLGFGMYTWDTINANEGDVSSIIIDDIGIGKTEDLYITLDGYDTFDIAYSSPITATKVPAGNDVKVTFNNAIEKSSFTSSSVTVNGVAVSNEQISFGSDDHTVILSDISQEGNKHYHVAFTNVADSTGKTLTDYIEFDTKLPDYVMSDIKFSKGTGDDEYVFAVTEPGVVNASFTALTNNGYALDMLYYLGVYKEDSNGSKLVSVASDTLHISGAQQKYSLSAEVPDDGQMYTLKALRWNRANLAPLCKNAELRDINDQKTPIAIIKLDDLSVSNISSFNKWQQFAEDENIHLGFGVLCKSFAEDDAYVTSLAAIDNSPNIEVWLHGYDHQGGVTSEFREDLASQTQTFADCEAVANKAGISYKSFNPPFNELNEDTANLLEQKGYSAVMLISNSVSDYMLNKSFVTLYNENILELNAANSNADRVSTIEDFIAEHEALSTSGKKYIVYQGHPAQWNEASNNKFIKIVKYLKSIGTAFMEPADYARLMSQK